MFYINRSKIMIKNINKIKRNWYNNNQKILCKNMKYFYKRRIKKFIIQVIYCELILFSSLIIIIYLVIYFSFEENSLLLKLYGNIFVIKKEAGEFT